MATPARSGGELRASVLLVLALSLVALCYRGVLSADFVWDDHPLIDEQPFTQEIRPLSEYLGRPFWADPANPESRGFYRPLVSLSYALEWQLWSGRAAGFHATNLLLHLGCCALVFGLALRLGAPRAAALLAALLFGLHPRLTESVAWISGRTDVLAGLFSLLALWLHRTGRGRPGYRIGVGVCLLLGLLSKEVALAGIAALAAAEWVHRQRAATPGRESLLELAPAAGALGVWAALRILAAGPEHGLAATPFEPMQRLLFPFEALGRYLAMLFDPLRPRVPIGVLGVSEPRFVLLGAAVSLPLLLALAWRLWRRRSALLPLFALGTVPLLLVLNIVPLPAGVAAADRFLYLPLAALAIALAAASAALPPATLRPAAAGAALLAVAFAVATSRHLPVWADDVSLWSHSVRHAPGHDPLPHAQLGHALAWRGRLEEAIGSYRRALRIVEENPGLHGARRVTAQANLALALSEVGAHDEALRLLEEVAARRPRSAIHQLQLAAVHSRALRFDDAAAAVDRALALAPGYPLAVQLAQRVADTRRRFAALPPETPDEDVETLAERATVMAHAGRIRDADALWLRVVEHPAAPPRLVQQAAVHFAYGGYHPDAARSSFARLRALGADPVKIARLETVLDERRLLQ